MNLAFLILLTVAYWAAPSRRTKDIAFVYAGALSFYLAAYPSHKGYALTLAFDLAVLAYLLSRRGELSLFLSVILSGAIVATLFDAFRVYGLEYYSYGLATAYETIYTISYMAQVLALFGCAVIGRYYAIRKNYDKLESAWFIRASI